MDGSAFLKEQMIQEYISQINFHGNFSVRQIKEDLRRRIKEIPAVSVEWKKEDVVTEIMGPVVSKDTVKSVTIAFSDGENVDGTPKVHRVTYFI